MKTYGTATVIDTQAAEHGTPESVEITLSAAEMMIGPIDGRYFVRFTAPARKQAARRPRGEVPITSDWKRPAT